MGDSQLPARSVPEVELKSPPSSRLRTTAETNGAEIDTEDVPLASEIPNPDTEATRGCPCLAETHPLPPDAGFGRKCLDKFLCPPHSRTGAVLFIVLALALGWATLVAVTGDQALPEGNLFSLLVLFFACWCGGYVVGKVNLPPLLGMLLVGGLLGNVPHIDVAKDIDPVWSSGCRQLALTIILIRAGLGLDPQALRKLSFVVLRLAVSPCLTETIVDTFASHFILGLPWEWAIMLGFVIAAVSPAVVVPGLLSLSDRGYGIDKGIPTLIIAAASIDDVLAITGFGVMMGISFSTGAGNIAWTLLKGPLEVVVGVAFGVVGGTIIWYIPQKSSKHLLLFRSTLLLLFCAMAIFGSKAIGWAGAGPLGALTLPFVAALRWRQEFAPGIKNPVEDVVAVLWMVLCPLLFGLIGAEVDLESLDPNVVGQGVAVLAIGLTFRILVSYLAVLRTDLNTRERLFVPIAWMPKATVQAAVGAVALDTARALDDEDMREELVPLGKMVLMMAVLVILITAPIGAVSIALSGPRLLKHTPRNPVKEEERKEEEEKRDVERNGEVEVVQEEEGLLEKREVTV